MSVGQNRVGCRIWELAGRRSSGELVERKWRYKNKLHSGGLEVKGEGEVGYYLEIQLRSRGMGFVCLGFFRIAKIMAHLKVMGKELDTRG